MMWVFAVRLQAGPESQQENRQIMDYDDCLLNYLILLIDWFLYLSVGYLISQFNS